MFNVTLLVWRNTVEKQIIYNNCSFWRKVVKGMSTLFWMLVGLLFSHVGAIYLSPYLNLCVVFSLSLSLSLSTPVPLHLYGKYAMYNVRTQQEWYPPSGSNKCDADPDILFTSLPAKGMAFVSEYACEDNVAATQEDPESQGQVDATWYTTPWWANVEKMFAMLLSQRSLLSLLPSTTAALPMKILALSLNTVKKQHSSARSRTMPHTLSFVKIKTCQCDTWNMNLKQD